MPFDLPSSSSSTGATEAPAFAVRQGAAGGAGGLMAAASSLMGSPQRDPWAACLKAIAITRSFAPGVDRCELDVARTPDTPDVAVDDALSIQLGYGSSLSPVFSGKLARIVTALDGTLRLSLDSGCLALAHYRQNASFEQQDAGRLVRSIIGSPGLSAGTIENGASYPFIALDDRLDSWQWIARLARDSGLQAWFDAEGKLNFKTVVAGAPAASFRYGESLLALEFGERRAPWEQVDVVGEGAAGSQGSQAWSWLSKQRSNVAATGGSGSVAAIRSEASLRSMADAQGSARALAERGSKRAQSVRVRVPGNAALGPGDVISLSDCPGGRGDGQYLLWRIQHRFDKRSGFTSWLEGVTA